MLVACLAVGIQTSDQTSCTDFFHAVGEGEAEGRCRCCLNGDVVISGW